MTDRMGEVSAMNRLKKAQSLGFGPLMEKKQAVEKNEQLGAPRMKALAPPREFRSRSRSGGRHGASSGDLVPGNAAALAVRQQQEARREALRQVLKGGSDEPDLDGFLGQAKKASAPSGPKPAAALKMDVKVSKLDLKISSSTTARATAAASGARPKAAAGPKGPAPKSKEAEELKQRQQEEKIQAEFEQMQKEAKSKVYGDVEMPASYHDFDEYYDEEEEDQRKRKREEKKKREEWRKKRREELKKSGVDRKNKDGSSSESNAEEEDEVKKLMKEQKEDSKLRAQTWRTINNNGRYSKVAGTYVGQLSDRELDKRISDAAAKNAGANLMSEAEVLAKMNKGRSAHQKKPRSPSPVKQKPRQV